MKIASTLALFMGFVGSPDLALASLPQQPVDSATCPITHPQGGIYGNDALQAQLPEGGHLVFAGRIGFVDSDGALGIKFAWDRLVKGSLFVGGRRLDGDAAPARAYISDGYGDIGFQPIYLVFPTPGCWEIFGTVNDAKLTFVLFVEVIGDGPPWRFEGLERGWRVTTGCSEPARDKVPASDCPRPAAEPGG